MLRAESEGITSREVVQRLVEAGDLVIFTKGDLDGVAGSTNAMKVLEVNREE